MKRKTCCVIGCKTIPIQQTAVLRTELEQELAAALEDGCSRFVCGFSGTVDMLFAELVNTQKTLYANLFLEAFLTSGNQMTGEGGALRKELKWCNGIRIFSRTAQEECESLRDEEMIAGADRVIAVSDRQEECQQLSFARALGKDVRLIQF